MNCDWIVTRECVEGYEKALVAERDKYKACHEQANESLETAWAQIKEQSRVIADQIERMDNLHNEMVKWKASAENADEYLRIVQGNADHWNKQAAKWKTRSEAMERAMSIYTYCAYCVHQPDPECRGCRGRLPGLNVKTFVFDESRFAAHETAENEQQTDLINKNE